MSAAPFTSEVVPTHVRAWDLPTRLFHWLLVLAIVDAWVSINYADAMGDYTLRWHRWNGYGILVLLVFRLFWGVVGSSTSRFSGVVRPPSVAISYGRDSLRGLKPAYLGHNPLGSWMIILLFLTLLIQAMLGLFLLDHNGIVAGPLQGLIDEATAKTLARRHSQVFNVLLGLSAVHLIANLAYWRFAHDPLVKAMVTGVKPAGDYLDETEATIHPRAMTRAAICLATAALIVLGGIRLAGGSL